VGKGGFSRTASSSGVADFEILLRGPGLKSALGGTTPVLRLDLRPPSVGGDSPSPSEELLAGLASFLDAAVRSPKLCCWTAARSPASWASAGLFPATSTLTLRSVASS